MGFKIKKTVNGETVWEPIKAKKYTTSKITEYTGSLPITISANGDVLLDYRIYGTDGGVGVATENLFDKNLVTPNIFLKANGEIGHSDLFSISDFIPVENGSYLVHRARSGYTGVYNCIYDENKNFVRSIISPPSDSIVTIGYGEKYIRISINSSNDHWGRLNECMVVKGSTAPESYIPYGYKLPMTVSDGNTEQTVPVYIGENQLDSVEGVSDYVDKSSGKIVRMIGEYTFTGDEAFTTYNNYGVCYTTRNISPQADAPSDKIVMRCDHQTFTAINNRFLGTWISASTENNVCDFRPGTSQVVFRSTANFLTAEECQAYFKSQYDNGTPVKISYWLKTPVEEDLPVSLPEIPTIDGTTVIDYDGDPKPSQMYVKYNSWSGWSDVDDYKMVNGNWTQEVT